MSGKYILDTNILIGLFAGDKATEKKIAGLRETFVPVPVVAELYFGAYKSDSKKKPQNLERIDEFLLNSAVLDCDTDTAREYGKIKSELKAKARPIPENDIWIGAISRQHGLTVLTTDRHFENIDNLETDIL